MESLATALEVRVYEDYSEVEGYLSELPQTVAAARDVRKRVLDNPLYAGYLVAHDGRGVMLALRFERGLDSRRLIAIVDDVSQASRAAAGDVEQFLSGPLFVRLEISRLLLRDLFRVVPLAVLATLLVAAVGFRSAHGTLLPVVANGLAMLGTLALFVQAGHTLNYVTVILPPTVYVVGFAYVVHVISDFDRYARQGLDGAEAVRRALADVAAPVSLTAVTTACGFLALATSDIAAIRTYGLFAALGTGLAWLAALTVVPAGLALVPARAARGAPAAGERAAPVLAALAVRRGTLLLAAGAGLTLLAVWGAGRIEVSTDYLENFPPGSPVRHDFERMSSAFAGAVPLQVLVEAGAVDAMKAPAALREVEALRQWLLVQPEVGGVYTLVDYVDVLEQALAPELVDDDPVPASAGLVSHLVLLGAGEDVRRFAEPGFSSALTQVRANVVASAELNALTARIDQRLAALPDGLTGYVTGSSQVIAATLDDVTRGQVLSLAAAFAPILLAMAVLFRSLRLALLAMVPNVLPILCFFGILGLTGTALNLTTSLVAAVVLGIAVDDSIHFFARLRAAARRTPDDAAALTAALAAVTRPVTLTTAGLALGFTTLVAGELASQVEFGVLAAVTLALAWVLDLTLTPALAHRFGVATAARRGAGEA